MFFAALFASYFTIRAVSPDLWAQNTEKLNVPFASVNTTILVLSSLTCQLGVFAAERGQVGRTGSVFKVDGWGLREWFVLTYVMGAVFIAGQATEYASLVQEGVTIQDSAYGSMFYLTTGFHGLHVTGGLIAFLFVLGPHLHGPPVHPRAGGQRDRRVLLLALRRRGVDRPVRHDLPHPVTTPDRSGLQQGLNVRLLNRSVNGWRRLSRHRRGPLAGLLVLLLGLLLTGTLYAAFAPAQAEQAETDAEQVAQGPRAVPRRLRVLPRPERRGHLSTRDGNQHRPLAGRRRCRRGRLPGRHRPDADGPAGRAGPAQEAGLHRGGDRRAGGVRRLARPRPGDPRRVRLQHRGPDRRGARRRPSSAAARSSSPTAPPATTSRAPAARMPRGGYAPKIRGVEPKYIYEAMLTGPQADGQLLQRQPLARGEARRHRLPRVARGAARATAASASAASAP